MQGQDEGYLRRVLKESTHKRRGRVLRAGKRAQTPANDKKRHGKLVEALESGVESCL